MDERIEIFEDSFRYDPLDGVAMLKVSFERNGSRWAGFEEIFKETIREMGIDEDDLMAYLKDNRENLVLVCKELGI